MIFSFPFDAHINNFEVEVGGKEWREGKKGEVREERREKENI